MRMPVVAVPVTGSPPVGEVLGDGTDDVPGSDGTGVGVDSGDGEADADGDGDDVPAGQVWVRLNDVAVPVTTAVAPVSVHPAGVAM